MKKMVVILSLCAACLFLNGCATTPDIFKKFAGVSTKELEDLRKDAKVKVFDYDYNTCYEKVEKIIKAMPKTSIYAKDKGMIALYYIDPNTTPVGVFFKEIDAAHTQVEISSPGPDAKEWVAKNVFSETVLPATVVVKTF